MSLGSGGAAGVAVRLLALPLQAVLSVDRLVSRSSRRAEGIARPADLRGHERAAAHESP